MRVRTGEIKRAAKVLGVSADALIAQGWTRAPERLVQDTLNAPPEWLEKARRISRARRDKLRRRIERDSVAKRLGIGRSVVTERGLGYSDIAPLLNDPPDWLVYEQRAELARQLDVPHRTVVRHGIRPGDVDRLLAVPPSPSVSVSAGENLAKALSWLGFAVSTQPGRKGLCGEEDNP